MNPEPEIENVALMSTGPGTTRELKIVRYGHETSRPRAYLQAALHADEVPGLLVLHHLRGLLDEAQRRGAVSGSVALNLFANPIGLSQHVNGKLMGRYSLTGAGNFNRLYPDVTDEIKTRIGDQLSADADENVRLIREAFRNSLEARTPLDDTDHLRTTLLRLACEADIVLDLHCDEEALLHMYTGTPLWPSASDLSAQLGSRATLLAKESGGNPFDEAVAGIWWRLADCFPGVPVPPACLSSTVELRGEFDVDDDLALEDARSIFAFLQRRGVLEGDPGPLPEPRCAATPLEGVDMIRAPVNGIVTYTRALGSQVSAGDRVALLVDPAATRLADARTEVRTQASGLLFTRRSARFARAGDVLCKVAGPTPLAGRSGGPLLSD